MTEEDEEFNRIEREASLRKAAVTAAIAQQKWVGLTNEEVGDLSDFAYANDEEFVRNVEKKLKEKNENTWN
jgi:hypothetical protein